MTNPTEVAKIAGGLSVVQKVVVNQEGWAGPTYFFAGFVMRPLVRKGLFDRIDQKGFREIYEITETGLAVRAHLQNENTD